MKKTIFTTIAILSLVSCSKDVYTGGTDKDEITFNISFSGQTKASGTTFVNGDAVSLYAVEYDGLVQMPLQVSGNYFNNEKLTYDGSKWSGTRSLYWSENLCDFYALYPYQSNVGSVEEYPFSVAVDQDADNGAGYDASDLLFASAASVAKSDAGVALAFSHMMSKLVVKIVKGDSFEGDIPSDVSAHVYDVVTSCTVDFSKGSVEKDSFGDKNTVKMKKVSETQFEAVLVPQNIEKWSPLIELSMGGISYVLTYAMSFRPGYVHTVSVTLNTSPDQEQIDIAIDPSIHSW